MRAALLRLDRVEFGEGFVLNSIAENYLLSCADIPSWFRSHHWDVYHSSYGRLIADPDAWKTFRRNGMTLGLDDSFALRSKGEIYDGSKLIGRLILPSQPRFIESPRGRDALLEKLRGLVRLVGPKMVTEYVESEVGEPTSIIAEIDGKPLMLNGNEIEVIYFLWRLTKLLKKPRRKNMVIVEIGGGFGSLASKLLKAFPACKYVLLDLPEANALQHYYIESLYEGCGVYSYAKHRDDRSLRRFFQGDDRVAILPGWCASDLSDESVDLIINTRSFMEMNSKTVGYYFGEINRFAAIGSHFYNVNRVVKLVGEELICFNDYPYSSCWKVVDERAYPYTRSHAIVEVFATKNAKPVSYGSALEYLSRLGPSTQNKLELLRRNLEDIKNGYV